MLWLSALVILAGLISGSVFRAPMLLVGSAVIVACGLLAALPWQTWLTGLAFFQASYLASMFVAMAWARTSR